MSKYLEIQNKILQQIINGSLPEGGMLPSENQLAQAFGVTRTTIRRALKNLEDERYLTSKKGLGRIIRNRPKQILSYLNKLESIEAMIYSSGQQLIELDRKLETGNMNENQAKLLQCDEGSPYMRLVRLRAIENTPVAVTINIFPENKAPVGLDSFKGSLLSYMKLLGSPIDFAETTIQVPHPADPYAVLLHDNQEFVPIVICQQLHYDLEHPVFLSYDYLNTRVFTLTITRKHI